MRPPPGVAVTDEAQAMERLGLRAAAGAGLAVQHQGDPRRGSWQWRRAYCKMTERDSQMRIGQGFDVHAFGDGRPRRAGRRAHRPPTGVVAHSDGDVVIHALCDARAGRAGRGRHRPAFSGQRSALSRRRQPRVPARGGGAHARGRTAPGQRRYHRARRGAAHRRASRRHGGESRRRSRRSRRSCINIKATTTERLGFIGRGEGLAALAAVLLEA